MSVFDKNMRVNGRVRFYEKTPEIIAAQRALIDDQTVFCQRIAFTRCADPRVDILCVVEDAYAWLCADWVNQQHRKEQALRQLVHHYARKAMSERKDLWTGKHWHEVQYATLFADVADEEVMKGLRVIDAMPEAMKRVFEARRVYAYPMTVAAARLRVSRNSVGTTKADARIGKVTDLDAVVKFFADHMEGGS
ncbi:hypothetical protein Snoj_81190 [Streptomyces nojiriensis]|uniref:Uncharacterized protein n=1 Tax=Streptomyces nojiriensis TaxID=66374 RepID=A0ABQ3T1F7_9ACTN|nr:hypothetical protein [Streptomyces nojiriensis]QTI47700.1 hypothetical protein JYK04_05549 [Streptomyces nojiriensis]GGR76117.1 hypothetical protein GCM10010205_01120 [Streptomyces nojiriensis]GHI74201.1 hypothetical protein Snoj_81190 [Streptomyces nojiriensis]